MANLDHAVKKNTPFSFMFDSKVRYEAFKALFEAIEEFAPNMVVDLNQIAETGTFADWRNIEALQMAKQYSLSAWNALKHLAEEKDVPFHSMQDQLIKWSDRYHLSAREWDFLRDAAIMAIFAYHEDIQYRTLMLRANSENMTDQEIVELYDNHPAPYTDTKNVAMALTRIVPPIPQFSLSKLCRLNTRHDRWGKPISYMHSKLRDDAFLFERLHPFVFAPPAESNDMLELPEALRKIGYSIELETNPAENLLYRERALMQANTPSNDPRAKEVSKWFYGVMSVLDAQIFSPKEFTGIAYDPRRKNWSEFETEMKKKFQEYLKVYKAAAESWFDSYGYMLEQPLSELRTKAEMVVKYFMLNRSQNEIHNETNKPQGSNINREIEVFFKRALFLPKPAKTKSR
ncbi:hypothetical protein [Ferroacidibacillus organovorans]|uniref:Uncharacterized protein n=1 Tax=Ferroacidibacillus organovorans TaxID=1765683 RepID=A0A1V4ETJ5_9BACL|nr:hypothetical protein [Ferroacidibacillus organovorans]OPG16255.1 hypothetical protein B2M26_08075 [Ferroacidibacillus organovorans]